LTACAAALTPAACGGDDSPTPRAAPARAAAKPALCARLSASILGEVATPEATELSGLAISHAQRGVLWTHNDSGDSARVFAITSKGRLVAEVTVAGAQAVDWEDIAVGPGTRRRDALYVADIGDNDAARPDVVVYRMREPRVAGSGAHLSAAARALTLRYPDGAHDAEALLVSPSNGALFVVTKSFSGRAGVYLAAHPRAGGTTTMRRVATIALAGGDAITAGDVSADGRTIAVRSYFRAYAWKRRRGETIAAALRRRPCAADADLFDEGQGEALALTRDGRAFYSVPEGALPDVRRYAPSKQ
jgi:hypothetical protein